jgi:PadR family transcriptional regulator PadR
MLKGILDGCLLAIIQEGEVYGYELAEKLESYGFEFMSEGTIYPLLMRMQKEKLVTTTSKKSTAGPRRKYYFLTEKGEEELEAFKKRWVQLSASVDRIIKKGSDQGEK